MKVLVYDEWIPWPLESGKKIRTYNLLKHLSRKHDIIFMSFLDMNDSKLKVEAVRKICSKFVPVTDTRIQKGTLAYYIDVMRHFFSRQPYSLIYHMDKEYIRILQKTIAEERPDIVHCEWSILAPYLKHIDGIPSVITAHNIESDIWKRLGENGSNMAKRVMGKTQFKKIDKLERYWYPRTNRCIAVSELDQNVIRSYGADVSVVENGVDLDYYAETVQFAEADCISFTASFDTFSNQDAVDYLFKAIYPHLLRKCKNIKIMLIGKSPPKRFYDYIRNDKNVIITGTVDDIRTYASRSTISIVPLRIGGGTRLKILEAMALKLPVVSTSIGAEGLMVKNGENILLADDPKEFADCVIRLLRDQNEREKIINNAYKLVQSQYDWRSLAEKQDLVWLSAINSINNTNSV
jgi:glycosyltransferase involved in cell wall biosynthesis